jgi:hypothetical protein
MVRNYLLSSKESVLDEVVIPIAIDTFQQKINWKREKNNN